MKRAFILIMVTIIAVFFAFTSDQKTENDSEIPSVIYENLKSAENENLESYMDTIHEQSPIYAATERQMKQIFTMYNLTYRIESIKVIKKSVKEVKVRFVQITKKLDGPAFRNNKLTGIHILKKSNGKWKLYSTEIEDVEFLN